MAQNLGCWFIMILLIFRLIIKYFGTLRMHQIAPYLSFFSGGACPQPPSTSVNQYHNRANYSPDLYVISVFLLIL